MNVPFAELASSIALPSNQLLRDLSVQRARCPVSLRLLMDALGKLQELANSACWQRESCRKLSRHVIRRVLDVVEDVEDLSIALLRFSLGVNVAAKRLTEIVDCLIIPFVVSRQRQPFDRRAIFSLRSWAVDDADLGHQTVMLHELVVDASEEFKYAVLTAVHGVQQALLIATAAEEQAGGSSSISSAVGARPTRDMLVTEEVERIERCRREMLPALVQAMRTLIAQPSVAADCVRQEENCALHEVLLLAKEVGCLEDDDSKKLIPIDTNLFFSAGRIDDDTVTPLDPCQSPQLAKIVDPLNVKSRARAHLTRDSVCVFDVRAVPVLGFAFAREAVGFETWSDVQEELALVSIANKVFSENRSSFLQPTHAIVDAHDHVLFVAYQETMTPVIDASRESQHGGGSNSLSASAAPEQEAPIDDSCCRFVQAQRGEDAASDRPALASGSPVATMASLTPSAVPGTLSSLRSALTATRPRVAAERPAHPLKPSQRFGPLHRKASGASLRWCCLVFARAILVFDHLEAQCASSCSATRSYAVFVHLLTHVLDRVWVSEAGEVRIILASNELSTFAAESCDKRAVRVQEAELWTQNDLDPLRELGDAVFPRFEWCKVALRAVFERSLQQLALPVQAGGRGVKYSRQNARVYGSLLACVLEWLSSLSEKELDAKDSQSTACRGNSINKPDIRNCGHGQRGDDVMESAHGATEEEVDGLRIFDITRWFGDETLTKGVLVADGDGNKLRFASYLEYISEQLEDVDTASLKQQLLGAVASGDDARVGSVMAWIALCGPSTSAGEALVARLWEELWNCVAEGGDAEPASSRASSAILLRKIGAAATWASFVLPSGLLEPNCESGAVQLASALDELLSFSLPLHPAATCRFDSANVQVLVQHMSGRLANTAVAAVNAMLLRAVATASCSDGIMALLTAARRAMEHAAPPARMSLRALLEIGHLDAKLWTRSQAGRKPDDESSSGLVEGNDGSSKAALHMLHWWASVVVDTVFDKTSHEHDQLMGALVEIQQFIEAMRERSNNEDGDCESMRMALPLWLRMVFSLTFATRLMSFVNELWNVQAASCRAIVDPGDPQEHSRSVAVSSHILQVLKFVNIACSFDPIAFATHDWYRFFFHTASPSSLPFALRSICNSFPPAARMVGMQHSFPKILHRILNASEAPGTERSQTESVEGTDLVAHLLAAVAPHCPALAREELRDLLIRTHSPKNHVHLVPFASLCMIRPSVFSTRSTLEAVLRIFDHFKTNVLLLHIASGDELCDKALTPRMRKLCVALVDYLDASFTEVNSELAQTRAPRIIVGHLLLLLDMQSQLPRNVWRAVNLILHVKENRPMFAITPFRDRLLRFAHSFDAFDHNTFVFGAIVCSMMHTRNKQIMALFDTQEIRRFLVNMPLAHWAYFDSFRFQWRCVTCNLIGHRSASIPETATPPPRWQCIRCKGPVWQPDDVAARCHHPRCVSPLMRFKRHHCRSCGFLFCQDHCRSEADPIPDLQFSHENGQRAQRMCDMCAQVTQSYWAYKDYKYHVPARNGHVFLTDGVGVAEYFRHRNALAWMVRNNLGHPHPERAALMANSNVGTLSIESQQSPLRKEEKPFARLPRQRSSRGRLQSQQTFAGDGSDEDLGSVGCGDHSHLQFSWI